MTRPCKSHIISSTRHCKEHKCIRKYKSTPVKLTQNIDDVGNSIKYPRQLKLCVASESGEEQKLLGICELPEQSKERWLALSLFSALACSQSCIWNTWGPVATSAMIAFPSWKTSTIALLSNWGCITFLTCCLPCCWLLHKKDLIIPIRIAAICTTVATLIRCISSEEIIFSIMAHLASITNGIAGVIIGPASVLVSATWFPVGGRTTATGISSAVSQLGIALSYLIGPTIIEQYDSDIKTFSNYSNQTFNNLIKENKTLQNYSSTNLPALRVQFMSLMRIELVAQILVLFGILWFYPRNPSPVSEYSSTTSYKVGLFESMVDIIRNKSMWFLLPAAALSQSVTGPWLTMITVTFGSTVPEKEAVNLAFWTIICSSVLTLVTSHTMDLFQQHLKIAIFSLLATSSAMLLWILLLDSGILTFEKHELYVAVILGISMCWATSALFLELASEIAFPVSEAIVGGCMIFLTNFVGFILYVSYSIPGIDGYWFKYCAFANLILSSVLVINVKDDYNRTMMSISSGSCITLFTNEGKFKTTTESEEIKCTRAQKFKRKINSLD